MYDTEVTVFCEEGYVTGGQPNGTSICLANATWSEPPQCERKCNVVEKVAQFQYIPKRKNTLANNVIYFSLKQFDVDLCQLFMNQKYRLSTMIPINPK